MMCPVTAAAAAYIRDVRPGEDLQERARQHQRLMLCQSPEQQLQVVAGEMTSKNWPLVLSCCFVVAVFIMMWLVSPVLSASISTARALPLREHKSSRSFCQSGTESA